jgi:hypothetical protein
MDQGVSGQGANHDVSWQIGAVNAEPRKQAQRSEALRARPG